MIAPSTRIDFGDTTLTLFVESDAAYDDMLATIGQARESVWLETYIFSADEIGWQFAEALAERARAGVQARLRVDSAGALQTPYSKRIRRNLLSLVAGRLSAADEAATRAAPPPRPELARFMGSAHGQNRAAPNIHSSSGTVPGSHTLIQGPQERTSCIERLC